MAKDKKKGLGTGLEALFAEDVTLEENEAEDTEVTQLPIMKIEPRGRPGSRPCRYISSRWTSRRPWRWRSWKTCSARI